MKGIIRLAVWIALPAILLGHCICKRAHIHAAHPPKAGTPGIDSIREAVFGINRVFIRFT